MKKFFKRFGLFTNNESYETDTYKFKIGDTVKILIYPKEKYIGEVVDRSYYTTLGLRKEEFEVKFQGRGGEIRHWYLSSELEHFDQSKERDYKISLILG